MPIDDCRVHHIAECDPAREHGPTDLHNLIPVCDQTHNRVHQHGWAVKASGNHDRMIWTRPDGTVSYNGPAGNRKPRSNPSSDKDSDDADARR